MVQKLCVDKKWIPPGLSIEYLRHSKTVDLMVNLISSFCFIQVDLLVQNEEKNSSDRLTYLEKHVLQQNDELICLKSALADVIRRVQQLEQAQATHQQQTFNFHQKHRSPNKLSVSSSRVMNQARKQTGKESHESRLIHSSSNNSTVGEHHSMAVIQNNKTSLARAEKSHQNGSLHGSKANSLEKLAQGNKKTLQVSVDYNQQPLSLNSDSGLVKFFLRGRPISLYLPSANQVSSDSNEFGFKFDTESVIKAPPEQLKLEWVYGYRGELFNAFKWCCENAFCSKDGF